MEVSFVTSADGTRIAWSRHGSGPPLVWVGTWLTHLDHDWSSPVWRHWLDALGQRFTVIRYDDRGGGLSDRAPVEYSLKTWRADLEAVIAAAGVHSFTLFGMSQGGAVAVDYAHTHPDRVNTLILYGAYALGAARRGASAEEEEERLLREHLIKVGWGRADPVFRRVFTTSFIPEASESQMRWFDELQRRSMSPEAALASSRARAGLDLCRAAAAVTTPTLVVHGEGDRAVPFENGRQLARMIPGARFVSLVSSNHILLAKEDAWPQFLAEVDAFTGITRRPTAVLTAREIELVELVAGGFSNSQIADRMLLSARTVERHLSNVYAKLDLSGKSARAATAAMLPELIRRSSGT